MTLDTPGATRYSSSQSPPQPQPKQGHDTWRTDVTRSTHFPPEFSPRQLTSTARSFTFGNGVSLELVADGIRYFDASEERRELTGYTVTLDNGDGVTATVFLDQDGDETPRTFSELDACPEFRAGPLADAWQEAIDGRSEVAQAFGDAIRELAGELIGR